MSTSTNNAMCQVPPPTSTTDSLLRTRSLPRSFNTDSIHNENKADQSARPPRGHRRQQASIGLGIITTNLDISSTTTTNNNNNNENNNEKKKQESSVQEMKNDAFFNTSSIPLPRPPPALRSNASPQPPPPSSSQPITTTSTTTQNTERTSMELDEEDIGNRRISLASRLRTLVAANKSGTTPAPSPIPNNYMHKDNTNKSNLAVTGGGTTPRSYSDDEIMPLPSPAPGSSSPSSSHYPAPHHSSSSSSLSSQQQQQLYHHHPHKPHHLFPKHRIVSPPQLSPVTPDADENDSPPSPSASTSIPVIAVSPSLTPERKNKLPSLREEPMLGDIDDKAYHEAILAANNNTLHDNHSNNTTMIPTGGLVVPMMREYKFPSPSPLRYNEEDIVGKQIWDYQIGKLLGVGAFSKVYIANHLSTGQDYAIKMVNKERIAKDARVRSSIEREVGVLRFIDHPSIVRLEATMETEQHLCIVMEYAKGGELFDFVQKMHERLHADPQAKVDEMLIKRIFLQLVQIVQWMHEHSIIHRDLKLENIMIHMDESGNPRLKVTDFGLARVIDPNAPILTTRCGSEEYAAPEIVQSMGYDGRQTDTWALGVILYALLVGYLPFMYNPAKGEKVSHLFYRIVSGDYKWPSDWTQHPERAVSPEAKEVVEHILKRHPQKRITLTDVTKLAWFKDCP